MTLSTKPFRRLRANRDRVSASEYNRLISLVENMARSLSMFGIVDSSGFHTRKPPLALGKIIRIFEVQSEATGDGVYNCYEQTLDKTEWDDTAGDPKFDDKDTTEIEVLNLAEFDPEATYVAHLAADDLIAAWQMTDDEGTKRWVGVSFRQANADRVRLAYCSEAAPADNTITATLDHTTGTAITVTCHICGGAALNAAIPRLADNNEIFVTKIGGTWYCTTVFQTSEDCVCS